MYLIYNESTKPKIRKINEDNKYFIWDLIVMDTLEILLNGSDRMAWRGRLSTYRPQALHICNKETEDAITCIRILGFFPVILLFTTASPRLLIVSILVSQYDTTIWEPSPGLITHINPPPRQIKTIPYISDLFLLFPYAKSQKYVQNSLFGPLSYTISKNWFRWIKGLKL